MDDMTKLSTSLVQEVKEHFRSRLLRQIEKQGISLSYLSDMSGVSRSVLSSYVNDSASLPNTVNLVRIAAALNVDPSYFLPANKNRFSPDTLSAVIETSRALSHIPTVSHLLSAVKENQGQFMYYLPSTIPEQLKTDEVFRFEYRLLPDLGTDEYKKAIDASLKMELTGGILIDETIMLDLIGVRGRYEGLSPEAAEAQVQRLIEFSKHSFPNIQVKVVRFLDRQLSPTMLLGRSLMVHEFFDHVMYIRDSAMIETAREKINVAFRSGQYLIDWHDARPS